MNKNKVILYFSLFTLSASLVTSCTREDDLMTAVEEYNPEEAYGTYDESHWRRVHAAQRQAYIGDLYRSYGVGYGYNGTGKYGDYDEVRDRVIDLSAIQKYDEEHGSATLVDDVAPSSFHHVFSGTDAMTICKKLTSQASVKVDAVLFQAEVTTTYNKTDLTSNEFAFCTIHDGLTLASRHMEPYDLYYIAREHPEVLSPGFRRYQELAAEAIKNNNNTEAIRVLQNMMQTYGTHIIYHAKLGGKLKFSTTMKRHLVDTRNSVDTQAGVSFLYCIGTKSGNEKQDWVINTSTDRETHIEALGGNSALALKLSAMHDNDNMAEKSQILDAWFKSLHFDPSVDKDSNNVELVDIKVAPLSDLIIDHSVATLYNLLVGKHIAYETNVTPRARNTIYAKIPTSSLRLPDRSITKKVVVDHEVIGEILNEYVHNVEYSVYAKAYVTPLVRLTYDDNIYYNNGVIDILPADSVKTYTSAVNIDQAALYMWNDTCVANMKIGPYYLHQGVMASTSEDKLAMNTIRTLLKDLPIGYEVASAAKINEIVNFMYHSGEVFDESRFTWSVPPSFFSFKRFILFDTTNNQYGIFTLDAGQNSVTLLDKDRIGQALLRRTKDFKHM